MLLSYALDIRRVIINYFLRVCSSSFEPLRFGLFRFTSYPIRLPASRGTNLFKLCSSIPIGEIENIVFCSILR